MDSITQAALGAAVGEAVLGKRLGNRALAWGALLGTLPDLDVLISPWLDTANKLVHHRGASHSLLVMVLASFLLGHWLAKLWKRDKVSKARAGWFVFLVWSTHVLIDCFTVYGTSVLWPFSDQRVAFNHLFIIDPLYTGPLVVTLVWLAFLRKKKHQRKRRQLCAWGLGLSTLYAGLSVLAKISVSAGFGADLERRGVNFERRMEAPSPFNILLWRAVVDRGDELWVGYRTIFEGREAPVRWTVYRRGRDSFAAVADLREAQVLDWFSGGWWIARTHRNGVWIADLRFGEARVWEEKRGTVDARMAFSWVLEPAAAGDRLRQISPRPDEAGAALLNMTKRIVGDREAWEGNPRLAGIHGSWPETLEVVE